MGYFLRAAGLDEREQGDWRRRPARDAHNLRLQEGIPSAIQMSMGWRNELEDKYTVECFHCGHEIIDPSRAPNQKYIRRQPCLHCNKPHPDDTEE